MTSDAVGMNSEKDENLPKNEARGVEAAAKDSVASARGAETSRQRSLGPLGALVFFALVVGSSHLVAWLLLTVGHLGGLSEIIAGTICTAFPILTLAYAFYPQVFTKRFWRIPRNAWTWLVGLAALEAVGFMFGRPYYAPFPKLVALTVIFVSPPLEEIVRAVLLSPLLERWGKTWAIAITTVLTAVVHPEPLRMVVPMFLQTMMFVSTNRSIAATTLGHSLMNAFVVLAARV